MTPKKAFSVCVAGLLCLIVAGCGDAEGLKRVGDSLPTWQEPELLYLQPDPCTRLYVEIDTVEGIELAQSEEMLGAFSEFLREHCDKPEGIEFVQDEPIPLSEAEGIPPHVLALTQMDGPPRDR